MASTPPKSPPAATAIRVRRTWTRNQPQDRSSPSHRKSVKFVQEPQLTQPERVTARFKVRKASRPQDPSPQSRRKAQENLPRASVDCCMNTRASVSQNKELEEMMSSFPCENCASELDHVGEGRHQTYVRPTRGASRSCSTKRC